MRYYVYRTGSNAANQSMTFGPVHVATVEADSEWEAKLFTEQRVTVYNNQFLSVELADQVDQREDDINSRVTIV